MFDIGYAELILVMVVALLVVGPKDLPKFMKEIGGAIKKVRSMVFEVQDTLMKETESIADVSKPFYMPAFERLNENEDSLKSSHFLLPDISSLSSTQKMNFEKEKFLYFSSADYSQKKWNRASLKKINY